ncbi:hypothetical protein [Roseomonas sp. WA12]
MRPLLAALALLLLAGCAAPGPDLSAGPQRTALQEVEALPAEFGMFRRNGPLLNFEAQPGGAGMGAGARYVPSNGERMAVTVYVYDRGRSRAPEGAGSPEVAGELRNSAAELTVAARAGLYRSVKSETALTVGKAGVPEASCANFSIVQRDGTRTGDSICLTIWQGRFVKLRVTIWNPPESVLAGTLAAAVLINVRAILSGEGAPGPGART